MTSDFALGLVILAAAVAAWELLRSPGADVWSEILNDAADGCDEE